MEPFPLPPPYLLWASSTFTVHKRRLASIACAFSVLQYLNGEYYSTQSPVPHLVLFFKPIIGRFNIITSIEKSLVTK